MIEYPELNILAIVVGFIITNALGFLWYSDKTPTGQYWFSQLDMQPDEMEPDGKKFGLNFLFALITTWGIAMLVGWTGASTFLDGMIVGLFAWFAFILSTSFSTVVFESRKASLWLIYGGYQLVVSIILGIMFALW